MKVHDENKIQEFMKMLKELTSTKLEIGIFSDSGGDVLMIANVHEFGCKIEVTEKMRNYLHYIDIHLKKETKSIDIPERSFIRKSFDENLSDYHKKGEKLLEQVINLQLPVSTFFQVMGELAVGETQKYLTNLKSPPNSSITIKNKGSSNPLIDTGRLRESITFKVVRG